MLPVSPDLRALRAEFDALRRMMSRRPLTLAEARRLFTLGPIVGGSLL